MDDLLTIDQLSERLGVCTRTARNLMRKGQIPVIRLSGKLLRFSWRSVMEHLESKSRKDKQVKGAAK